MVPVYNIKNFIFISLICFLSACPVFGQVKKVKLLTEDDYGKWSQMIREGISDNGNWVQNQLVYDSGNDTLFVRNTKGKEVLAVAKGYDGQFFNDNSFVYMLPYKRIGISNLMNAKEKNIEGVASYQIAGKGGFLLLTSNEEDGTTTIKVLDSDCTVIEIIKSVSSSMISPDRNSLVYCHNDGGNKKVTLLVFLDHKVQKKTIASGNYAYFNPVWQPNSNAVAFLGQPILKTGSSGPEVIFYTVHEQKSYSFSMTENSSLKGFDFNGNRSSSLIVSDDGMRVFFTLKDQEERSNKVSTSDVEVWNASDSNVYPHLKQSGRQGVNKMGVWEPLSGRIMVAGRGKQDIYMLNGDQQYAITKDIFPYLPSDKERPEADYYVTNLLSGEVSLFLHQVPFENAALVFSPNGKSVAYFRENEWKVYNFANKTHITMPSALPLAYEADFSAPRSPYGFAGWTADGNRLLLFDQFDLWSFSIDGTESKRLTRGREEGIIFRVADIGNVRPIDELWFVETGNEIDTASTILLDAHSEDNDKSGYAVLSPSGKLSIKTFTDKKLSGLKKAKNKNIFLYRQEDYDLPPQIVVVSGDKWKDAVIFKSNPQHSQYPWGHSELISYQNKAGESLQGVLFYPFDYQPEKKYPMVVRIYQKQGNSLHTYIVPSLYNTTGYNTSNLTSQGYFVLHPDINYTIGDPGVSAVDCVIAATNAVISKGCIDPARIGLIGQSFGGYETFFIASQTQLFATAIAGAGISDMGSFYLSMGWNYKTPDAWRFEHQQFRMGKTLFEDAEGYRRNSAITFARDFSSPILSWTGDSDTQVNPEQSMIFYMAMRRLKKNHVMLRYPKEGHVILDMVRQADLSSKIMDWFNHYLKDCPKPVWSSPE
ncbi:S9 family peptidase [Flavobacterium rhamnosiphilum]|uniref:S9 family peptidase n=1 Tax=Flavobacterium rhamnosiphilum TaxID=2541724 RepID=A0A4R5F5A3_9FLAO|nr:prolyl oligopeptidase family serine peptidase [Flavobacterium rhamnosiphilum]TDE42942.1 S9 family peptidase [Flavobacterium rhamnosiphilum]